MSDEEIIFFTTESVCPECLQRIPAQRVACGDNIYLVKTCPEHGAYRTIVWRGEPDHGTWRRPKAPSNPEQPFKSVQNGCPFDCGLCSAHRQQPCCVLLEVTQHCDLNCPVCFADAGYAPDGDPSLQQIAIWYRRMLEAGGPFNIQLSGGEPCLRDDLPEIISLGRSLGFDYFQVNTNGLRLARELGYLKSLKKAGLSVVFLQFDGSQDSIYSELRGRSLLEVKKRVIENCKKAGIGVVLVPTLVPGVNTQDIGSIIRFALQYHPTVRSIHFQPISYFGRYPHLPVDSDRITIPEILRAANEQTNGLVKVEHFQPKGSENALCSFHAAYVVMPGGELKPLTLKSRLDSCCSRIESAADEARKARQYVAQNWAAPQGGSTPEVGAGFGGWDDFIGHARTHLFSISGMAFQDAWNLDLELLKDCCIQIMSNDGNLIPFCAYNLTSKNGRSLYRKSQRNFG